MLKNALVAIAAAATLGATGLASTQASACEYGDGSYGAYGYGYNSNPSYGYDVYSQPVYSLPSYDYGY